MMAENCLIEPVAAAVIAEAERWLGTPYRHQGSLKGVGCDCLGLVRGIWRALHGCEPEAVPPYQPDWAEFGATDRLAEAARRHLGPALPTHAMQPGDLLLFCWRDGMPAKHCAILTGPAAMIHAWEKAGVVRSPLVPALARRIAHIHRF